MRCAMNRSSLALPRSSEVGQCGQRLLRQNLFDIDSSKRFFARRRCCCVQSICPSKVMDCWNARCRWLAKVMNTHPPHSQQRLVVATAVKDSNPVSLLVSGYPFENYWLVSKRTDSRKGFQAGSEHEHIMKNFQTMNTHQLQHSDLLPLHVFASIYIIFSSKAAPMIEKSSFPISKPSGFFSDVLLLSSIFSTRTNMALSENRVPWFINNG